MFKTLNPTIPIHSKIISKIIAVFTFERNTFIKGFVMGYKSNTELRLVYNKSLMLIKNEMTKYSAKPKPSVTNVRYMNEVLTTFALIPKRSAIR